MFIQIYAWIVLITWLGLAYFFHGKEIPESMQMRVVDFRRTFVSILAYLPIFGRVLGWW